MPNTPQAYWRSYEPRDALESIDDLLRFISSVSTRGQTVVWRGVKNEAWGLHSSLYRYGLDSYGRRLNDSEFLRLEESVVAKAREWGMDRVPSSRSGLELLAWMQHTGSPTRLIDVSLNPLVAAWFACERWGDGRSVADGRIFAIASSSGPLLDDGRPLLPWVDAESANSSRLRENSTSLWLPPSLDPRIAAQSGAFLVGPLPRKNSGGNWYNAGESSNRYTADEVRALTSIPTRAYASITPGEAYRQNPLISVRVAADHKEELRERLEESFNLRPRLLFPDPYGLAGHLRREGPAL